MPLTDDAPYQEPDRNTTVQFIIIEVGPHFQRAGLGCLESFFFLEPNCLPFLFLLQCRKKHSYVCPQFEISGRCPWGPACKLHHPDWANKKASRLQKRKRARTDNHTQGRYFGGVADEADGRSLPPSVRSEARGVGDIFFQGGRFADYISLDDNDDGDDDDNGVPLGSPSVSKESYLPDPLSKDADVLIKPLRIMCR